MKFNTKKNLALTVLLTWSLLPMLLQLYTSFLKPEVLVNDISQGISPWTLANYKQILFSEPPFWRFLFNSIIVGSCTTFITILIATPASYTLSRMSKKASRIFNFFLLIAALFPYVLLFLALLEIARNLSLGNNLIALSVPYAGLSMPLAILLLTSAFKGIQKEIEEAAMLDGVGFWGRLRWILLPLITPALGSTSILIFLFSWNEYPIALTWLSRTNLLTLPVAISRIAGSSIYEVPYGAYAAATVLGAIPLIIIVLIFQRQIISGLLTGAVKG